jgi:MFS family permease
MPIVLYIIGFTASFADSSLIPVVPLYVSALGISLSQAGFIVAIYSYVTALLIVPCGKLSDKVGSRRFMVAGLTVFAVGPLLYLLASSPAHLILARTFHGLAFSFFLPAGFALAGNLARPEKKGEAMGWYTMALHIGLTVGPITGGFVLKTFGFQGAFCVSSGVAVIGLFLILTRVRGLHQQHQEVVRESSLGDWFRQKPIQVSLLVQFVTGFGMGNINTYVPLYCKSIGLTSVGAGLIITALFASSSLSRAPAGRLSDSVGRKPMITWGLILITGGVASVSQFASLPGLILTGILFGLGMGISSPATFALVAESSSSKMMGLSMAVLAFCFHFGLAVGPTSMGVAVKATGLQDMFLVCASVLALGFLAVVGFLKSRQ